MFYGRNRSAVDSYFIPKTRRFSDYSAAKNTHLQEALIQRCPRFNGSTQKYHGFSEDCVHKNSRYPLEERVMFERLWRGALCQAFGDRVPVRHRKVCCCHCQCGYFVGNSSHVNIGPYNNVRRSPKKTMRSVVR